MRQLLRLLRFWPPRPKARTRLCPLFSLLCYLMWLSPLLSTRPLSRLLRQLMKLLSQNLAEQLLRWRLPMAALQYMSLLSRAILKLTLSPLFLV